MTEDLPNNLLKQNGISPDAAAEAARQKLVAEIAALKRRARQTKTTAIVTWVLVALFYLVLPRVLMSRYQDETSRWAIAQVIGVITGVLFVAAIVYTILAYTRSRSAGMMEINAHLARLELQLAQLLQQRK